MSFYSDFNDIAYSMLSDFGQNATLIRKSKATGANYDPTTGGIVDSSQLTETRKIVPLDSPTSKRVQNSYGTTTENGVLEQTTQKWVYMDAKGSVPRLQDYVIIQGIKYTIFDFQVINPGGIDIIYLVVLTK